MTSCAIDGCDGAAVTVGLCHRHYWRLRTKGSAEAPLKNHEWHRGALCTVDGCERPGRKQGMCNSHYTTVWRLRCPDKAKLLNRTAWRRRRARQVGSDGRHTEPQWDLQRDLYGGRCAYCGGEAVERDHVTPLSAGGSDDILNIVPACRRCNRAKWNHSLLSWLLCQPIGTA